MIALDSLAFCSSGLSRALMLACAFGRLASFASAPIGLFPQNNRAGKPQRSPALSLIGPFGLLVAAVLARTFVIFVADILACIFGAGLRYPRSDFRLLTHDSSPAPPAQSCRRLRSDSSLSLIYPRLRLRRSGSRSSLGPPALAQSTHIFVFLTFSLRYLLKSKKKDCISCSKAFL